MKGREGLAMTFTLIYLSAQVKPEKVEKRLEKQFWYEEVD